MKAVLFIIALFVYNDVTTKDTVDVYSIDKKMYAAIIIAKYYRSLNHLPVLTITSANDSKHMEGSKHYKGLAIDIRTKDIPNKYKYYLYLKRQLEYSYEVIYYKSHIHIEYKY